MTLMHSRYGIVALVMGYMHSFLDILSSKDIVAHHYVCVHI